jgi:membrane associated rhomboid family serine protease
MSPQITPIVRNLLFINIGIIFIEYLLKLDLARGFGLYYFGSPLFEPYQLLSYFFLHSNFSHLFGNMLSLFFFGPLLESYMGAKRFLNFYVICGFGASALYMLVNFFEISSLAQSIELFDQSGNQAALDSAVYAYKVKMATPLVGASGAVFGILMAFAMLFPNMEMMLLFPPIPIKAKYFVGLYGAYEIYSEIWTKVGDNVAHTAHLGGMLFAFILLRYWGYKAIK